MKRFIALLLTFALLLFTAVPTLCFDIDPSQEDTNTNIDRKTLSYITDVLPTYFSASKSAIDLDSIYITQGYNLVGGESTAQFYFIFSKSEYIGRLIVDVYNGDFCSNFMFDDNQTIAELVNTQTPFMLESTINESIALVWGNGYEVVRNPFDTELDAFQRLETTQLEDSNMLQPQMTQLTFTADAIPQIDTSGQNVSLDIPLVANNYSDFGEGLCWTASIAAISNYKKGTSYTAYSLYSALKEAHSGEPSGVPEWYKIAYDYLNISYSLNNGAPKWQTIYNMLCTGRPIFLHVSRTSSAHAIVCKSFSGGVDYALFGFMDPNLSDYQYITYRNSTLDMNSFVYTNGQATYNTIVHYIY